MSGLEIRPLTPDEIKGAVDLLQHLNPDEDPATLEARLHRILADHPHYEIHGASLDGELVGVAGVWIATKLWCGRYLEIDHLVVDPHHRADGIGTTMIRHFEKLAVERECLLITLDAYTSNHASHRLYHRLGYEIWGFHFVRKLGRMS
jgi:GNAT superfamily N-acetyltransferase